MSFIVDTDLLSFFAKRNVPRKLERWLSENDSEIFLSIVTIAEIEFGVRNAPTEDRERLVAWARNIRTKFAPATLELSEGTLIVWKQLLADLKRINRTIQCEDSLIAATALHNGHTVATRNTRHFEATGVAVINPLD